jgi:anti-anti-sigma factor
VIDLREESRGGVKVLDVRGRVDSGTAPTLGERLNGLLANDARHVVVDFQGLEYISSAGFRVLLLAARRADEAQARLVMCGLSDKVRQLFDLGGFLDLFVITSSRDEAFSSGA